jgi:hypothetical protein
MAGASVTITSPAIGVTQTATTNEIGVFVFPQLPPGNYVIKAEKSGFKKIEKSKVILSTGDKLNVAAIVLGHVYEAYMTVGAGEVCRICSARGRPGNGRCCATAWRCCWSSARRMSGWNGSSSSFWRKAIPVNSSAAAATRWHSFRLRLARVSHPV